MKSLNCERCGISLGDMLKGKIKKGTVLLCKKCYDKIKLREDAEKLSRSGNNSMPDIFKDIFNK